MYAGGTDHPLKQPAAAVIRAVAAGEIDGVTDAEVLQEILHRYLFINQREKGFRIFDRFRLIMAGRVFPITDEDVQRARALAEEHHDLSPRDLVHLAVMKHRGIGQIITSDRGFDGLPGIRRLDPIAFRHP